MGLATARLLAFRGASISLADINEEGLKSAIASLASDQEHMYTVVDVRNSEKVNDWIKCTIDKYGKLDGAVNMAGIITKATPVKDLTDADWDFSFAVNTKGVFNCLRAQLNAMQDGGSIVSLHLIGPDLARADHRRRFPRPVSSANLVHLATRHIAPLRPL